MFSFQVNVKEIEEESKYIIPPHPASWQPFTILYSRRAFALHLYCLRSKKSDIMSHSTL